MRTRCSKGWYVVSVTQEEFPDIITGATDDGPKFQVEPSAIVEVADKYNPTTTAMTRPSFMFICDMASF